MNYSNKNMKSNFYLLTFLLIIFFTINGYAAERKKYNFNSEWRLQVGDFPQAKKPDFKDSSWKQVTLPHAFNEDEAFRISIEQHTDTVVWSFGITPSAYQAKFSPQLKTVDVRFQQALSAEQAAAAKQELRQLLAPKPREAAVPSCDDCTFKQDGLRYHQLKAELQKLLDDKK